MVKAMKTRKVLKILRKYGWKKIREGRHTIYENQEGKRVPVPTNHEIITKGVIKSLIRQTEIPEQEFS